jgi:glucokinase
MTSFGLDVGGSSIKWATLHDNEIVDSGSVPTPGGGAGDVVETLLDTTRVHAPDGGRNLTIGVALPASIDIVTSEIISMPNVPGDWAGVRLADLISDSRPAGSCWTVVNDARAFAAGELVAGEARAGADVLAIAVGTGVGGALVLDGALWLGSTGLVGELGHVVVDPMGRLCGCGRRGCLETYVGAAGILAEASHRGLIDSIRDDGAPVTVQALFDEARSGARELQELVTEGGDALGTVIARFATFLAPTTVVIGGGVAESLDLLLPSVDAAIDRELRIVPRPQVLRGQLGRYAGAAGAAAWAHGDVPSNPVLSTTPADPPTSRSEAGETRQLHISAIAEGRN